MEQRIIIAKKQGLNWQAILIEETQTDLKVLIKKALVGGINTYTSLRQQAIKRINECVKELESEDLKRVTALSLLRYVEKMLADSLVKMGIPVISLMLAYSKLTSGANFQQTIEQFKIRPRIKAEASHVALQYGVPSQIYDKDYKKQVKEALDNLAQSEAKYDEHISLRNVAEMTVRYERTMASIEEFKRRGINLVVSSSHANCSKRCEVWQGGHYTLDNTYQIVDGIEFQPLSNATDQYYTTRAGKVYKNGHITGYNCRHYLMEYKKGVEPQKVSAKVVEQQREIDHKMRYMERQVRIWKDKALMYKNQDKELYLSAKNKANEYNIKYIEFAKRNKRAYYPSRTDIF